MPITKAEFSGFIKNFQFRELFNEMGWNNDCIRQPIIANDLQFNLVGIAEKRGFKVFICEPAPGNQLPDKILRKKIEAKTTKLFQEHLIIFIDAHKQEQIWQLAVRKAGCPTKISETRFLLSQDPELLYQRASGLFFTLDEEEKVTIIDVTKRVADNFQQNNEKVTKKFYESFKKEHTAFMKFIQGIDDQFHMDWYASLMLNRLMFCYFIQKKGFLDDNKNYLQDKLKACMEKKGKNQFYSFYRDFLLALFHEGLGAPECSRDLEIDMGKIPYLNGGLFEVHEIEKAFTHIQIEDKAFEKLFNFFDQYEWHLDTRETASGKDINPDVIGYIFEKYINDRAQMGAYYTKEDITDYISKNCIIPWLFDEVKRHYPKPFAADGWLWQMVKASSVDYIYDAVKHGIPDANAGANNYSPQTENATIHDNRGVKYEISDANVGANNHSPWPTGNTPERADRANNYSPLRDDLPEDIQKGFDSELEKKVVDGNGPWLWELRKSWNKPAPPDIALPTEIYREVIERRKRYADIKSKIENGDIKEINDFITYNLNIRQFAQDVIETTDDAGFIRHFYKALSGITILDPTCGSGAFLFAAMNILEPLYEACIVRMQNFTDESGKGRHLFFEEVLAQVNAPEHPNLQYFIYKSIILNNLYGVDIMNEAVEIAKLRLFLKLVASVQPNYHKPNLGLEPLPDVDFNIRHGNTLVGYATETQLDGAFKTNLNFDNDKEKIKEKCDMVGRTFARYKEIQLAGQENHKDFKQAKDDLNRRLNTLRLELDQLLQKQQYSGINEKDYDQWHSSHQPFHWFAEFYEIIHGQGGFDVIIGNPPYVEYSKVKSNYKIIDYKTESCGNLYAFVMERADYLLKIMGYFGFIIPISFVCTQRMALTQDVILKNSLYVFLSNYAERPSKLFFGAEVLLTIVLTKKGKSSHAEIYSTGFTKWSIQERFLLFERTNYTQIGKLKSYVFPKISSFIEADLLSKIISKSLKLGFLLTKNSKNKIYYRIGGGRYWKIFTNFQPKFILNGENSTSSRENYLYFHDENTRDHSIALLSSSSFYWYFILSTNCRDLNPSDLTELPFSPTNLSLSLNQVISQLTGKLMEDYQNNSQIMEKTSSFTGKIKYQEFYPRLSKSIIDKIDCLLAQHYGFTQEELDFIINYDIKYRMGKMSEQDLED